MIRALMDCDWAKRTSVVTVFYEAIGHRWLQQHLFSRNSDQIRRNIEQGFGFPLHITGNSAADFLVQVGSA
ncbi:hypothetical protein D5086_032794 [Populus alba]|uniref:Uncharacterized protein n=1 Tax=Populus alba TaxID=43335 RepID=A0ACC4AF12_POPAL